MISVYTASGWPFRADIAKINERLNRVLGVKVISTWIENEDGDNSPANCGVDAKRDTDQVAACDVLLAIMNDAQYAYRGTWTEIGFALGTGKRVIVVCPGLGSERANTPTSYAYSHVCQTNVFFWHPAITRVRTLEEAIALL